MLKKNLVFLLTVIFLLNISTAGMAEESANAAESNILVNDMADRYKFLNVWIDPEYDFSQVKKVFVLETDTADFSIYAPDLAEINANCVKKMKLKITNKNLADILVKIKIEDWKSEFVRRVPERITYEAYESYEGYEDVERYEDQEYYDAESKKTVRRRVKVRRKEFVVKPTWFFGSNKVITPHERVSGSRKISESTPFSGSQKVVHPAYDMFHSNVKILFEIYDAKSNVMIMNLEDSEERENSGKNYQMKLYKEMCTSFFKNYKGIIKHHKKIIKQQSKI